MRENQTAARNEEYQYRDPIDLETKKHGQYRQYGAWVSYVVVFCSIVGYGAYGIDKMGKSIANPQVATSVHVVESYEMPLVHTCPFALSQNDWGSITPFKVIIDEEHGLCESVPTPNCLEHTIVNFSEFAQSGIDSFDRSKFSWIADAAGCWTLVPPKGFLFSRSAGLRFAWNVADEHKLYSLFDNSPNRLSQTDLNKNFILLMLNQLKSSAFFNTIHPDFLENLVHAAQTNSSAQKYFGSDTNTVGIWSRSSIYLSLYSKELLSGEVQNYYEVKNGENFMYWNELNQLDDDLVAQPYFDILIYTNQVPATDGSFKSFSKEINGYQFADFCAGLGGFIGLVLQIFAMLVGVVFAAQYLGFITNRFFGGWQGLAPYPPFDEQYEERLRRFIRQEMWNKNIFKEAESNLTYDPATLTDDPENGEDKELVKTN